MFKLILIIVFIIAIVISYPFRCFCLNPFKSLYYACVDTFLYIRYKKWRNAPCGSLIGYTGLFGKGKTLSAVHAVVSLYKQYNNLVVYDKFRSKYVRQRILILSNVELCGIPYKKLESLRQIVALSHQVKDLDDKYDTLTYIYVLADELSVQLNSRDFKKNIDPLFLNTLLTCRHYHISMYYTAQRFNQVDALLRQVTQHVYDCDKNWRFQIQYKFSAYELENCTNPRLVQPLGIKFWFVRNKDYGYYDTLACVSNLEKSALTGDMLSPKEILELQQAMPADTVERYSKKAKKRRPFKIK